MKVTEVTNGTIDSESSNDDKYLIPLSAVTAMGNKGLLFVTKTDENNKTTVSEVTVNITGSDDLYYEVISDQMYDGIEVVYSTSKAFPAAIEYI